MLLAAILCLFYSITHASRQILQSSAEAVALSSAIASGNATALAQSSALASALGSGSAEAVAVAEAIALAAGVSMLCSSCVHSMDIVCNSTGLNALCCVRGCALCQKICAYFNEQIAYKTPGAWCKTSSV